MLLHMNNLLSMMNLVVSYEFLSFHEVVTSILCYLIFLVFKKDQTSRKINLRNRTFRVILQDNETLIRMYCQFCSNLLY